MALVKVLLFFSYFISYLSSYFPFMLSSIIKQQLELFIIDFNLTEVDFFFFLFLYFKSLAYK
jgi:hypothetical protein